MPDSRRGRITRALLRLYPRAWRARYGEELGALMDATPLSWRVCVDLVRGAAREWVHELSSPHVFTPGWRLAWRTLSRVLTSVAVAAAILFLSRYLASRVAAVEVPVLVVVLMGALHLGLVVRVFLVLRSSGWGLRATGRSVVSYREFVFWVVVASTVETVYAMGSTTPTSVWAALFRWWLWIDWLLAATPRALRHARIEQRLMRRPRLMTEAIARFERRRAENAARLIAFYAHFTVGAAGSAGPGGSIASTGQSGRAGQAERA